MKSVDISIIIPNYNNEKYLADCLDSVLRQSVKDIEIILTDDCSTDGSGQLIHDYVDRYPDIIRTVFHPMNVGIARNRHDGILESRGRYITTLDSDDMYDDSRKLEREYDLIKKHENDHQDIIAFSNVKMLFNDSSEQVVGHAENICEGDIYDPLLLRRCFIPRDFLFKREMYFKVGGYNPGYKIYEDWNLKLKLAKHYHFHYTGTVGVIYRRHGNGLSARGVHEHLRYLRKSFSEEVFSLQDGKKIRQYKHDFERYLLDTFGTGYRKESGIQRLIFSLKCTMH